MPTASMRTTASGRRATVSTRQSAGHNVKAGEEVRWLPRRQASDLALPGNDFWLFDGSASCSTTSPEMGA